MSLKILRLILGLALTGLVVAVLAVGAVIYHYGQDLPDYSDLADYQPPVTTRVYAGDGHLLTEFATERRIFVPIDLIPKRIKDAFISAEDKNFYSHHGVDPMGILGRAVTDIGKLATDRRPQGASTITQQVTRLFLLTNELSITRKVKEILLALRIERAYSKDHILELYLNEIYLGGGAYGVAAAAVNYFGKPLDQLDTAEAAYLAALPKAPNTYNAQRNLEAARARRDWVLARMTEDGHITAEEARQAQGEPLQIRPRNDNVVQAAYFAEEVRRWLAAHFGQDALYTGGLAVRTTVDSRLQRLAEQALRRGLVVYDHHHGWRGPVTHIDLAAMDTGQVAAQVTALKIPGLEDWKLALVTRLAPTEAEILVGGTEPGRIPLADMKWARRQTEEERLGPAVSAPSDVLRTGDVVAVAAGKAAGTWVLEQLPAVDGGLVAMDPHTGRILAMAGGFSYERSQFNRVTQAMRQPGSSFKPFVYLPALDSGFTPSTLIMDAPFVIDQGPGLGKWKPGNDEHDFKGPTTMRVGIEESRNLMTIRMAQAIGMEKVADYAQRFGVIDNLPPQLSMAIGAGNTTLLRLTTGYSEIVNGGKKITPTMIDRIQDRQGKTIYRHDDRPCPACTNIPWTGQATPKLADNRAQLTDPASAYQIVSILRGVAERGTAHIALSEIPLPLAGKTGTTNENKDTWFIGFSPDLACGVFVGFDDPKSLGREASGEETGGRVDAPIFADFMTAALHDRPIVPFRIPPGIRLVRVDLKTGQRAHAGDRHVILEAFKPGTEPADNGPQNVIDGGSAPGAPGVPSAGVAASPDGIY